MFRPKFKFTYDEVRIIVMALVELKNQLIAEGRYTDAVDDLLICKDSLRDDFTECKRSLIRLAFT